jgi:fumarate reductase subunit D
VILPTSIGIAKILHGKLGVVFVGSMFAAAVLVAADTSPYTVWILGALIPIGLLIAGLLWNLNREKKKERDETQKRLTILEVQMSPFWATLQTKLADALHHPHPESKEKDALLEKLEALTISPEERIRLNALLINTSSDTSVSTEERTRAKMLLLVMPVVTGERHDIIAAAARTSADTMIKSIEIAPNG